MMLLAAIYVVGECFFFAVERYAKHKEGGDA